MTAPTPCPTCGRQNPAGTACPCGHAPAPPFERPFGIGKPLATKYPLSKVCPQCGAGDYKSVQPTTMVAFAWDRVCKACSTRYTPPTPLWGRAVFGVVGFAALAVAASMTYGVLAPAPGRPAPSLGLITPFVVGVVGLACLYKAATK